MKSGAILIEVLVATLISSIISAALFTSFYQMNKYSVIIDDSIATASKAALFSQQLEHDLLGVFIPVAADLESEKEQAQPASAPTAAGAQAGQKQTPIAPTLPAQKPPKPVDKVFVGTIKDKEFEMLTFITDNPMQVYWSEKSGKAKPRIARVVYRLVKDLQTKKSFNLMRQEGSDLYFDAYKPETKKIREYLLIDGIKSLSIEYIAKVEPKEKEKEKEEKPTFKTTKEWKDKSQKKQETVKAPDNQKKSKEKLFPDYVKIKLSLWDTKQTRETAYEFKMQLLASGDVVSPAVANLPAAPAPTPAQSTGQAGQNAPQAAEQPSLFMQQFMVQPGAPAVAQQVDAKDNFISKLLGKKR